MPGHERWIPACRYINLRVTKGSCLSLSPDVGERLYQKALSAAPSGYVKSGDLTLRKQAERGLCSLEILLSAGFRRVKNLKGGINAWAQDVDTSLPVY